MNKEGFDYLSYWKKIGYDSVRLMALNDIVNDYNLNTDDTIILQRLIYFKDNSIILDFSDGTPEIENLDLDGKE